ncbi:MAG: hypothetical protein ACYDG3_10480, partial [Bacillati bacterium]
SVVRESSRAPQSTISAIQSKIEDGSLDESLVLEDTGLSFDEIQAKIATDDLDIPLANKITNTYEPISRTANKAALDHARQAFANGKLSDADFESLDITADDLTNALLTKRQLYKLNDLAKSRASAKQRQIVEFLIDKDYNPPRSIDPSDLDNLKAQDARSFIEAKRKLLTPDERATLTAIERGRPTPAITPTAVAESQSQFDTTIKQMIEQGAKPLDINGIDSVALEIVASGHNRVVGYTDEKHQHFVDVPARALGKKLAEALKNDPATLAGRFAVLTREGRNPIAELTSQGSHDAAMVEHISLQSVKRMMKEDVTVSPTPDNGSGIAVYVSSARQHVGVKSGDTLHVVPKTACIEEPRHLNTVTFGATPDTVSKAPKTKTLAASKSR